MTPSTEASALTRGRLCLVAAAVLWSLSGPFAKILTSGGEKLNHDQVACFRVLFAGLVLLPTVRRRHISFRPLMLLMIVAFAMMNLTFIGAIALGTAANAIFLQYTAPMWMFLASVWLLGEKPDSRSLVTLLIGLSGIAVIIGGSWQPEKLYVIGLGLASGLTYACVLLCLRVMRNESSQWMTVMNHLLGGLIVLPYVLWRSPPMPTPSQWVTLFLFGAVQMGLPYFLAAKGLQSVSPQEAATITLIEPVLTPILTWFATGEVPEKWTLIGGGLIIGALAWRYWPRREKSQQIQ